MSTGKKVFVPNFLLFLKGELDTPTIARAMPRILTLAWVGSQPPPISFPG
jgi:hypothetical protein